MQCKDLPELPILERLEESKKPLTHWGFNDLFQEDIPDKLRLAKMASLLRRGLVDGCSCGCRGDWEITLKGTRHYYSLKEERKRHEKARGIYAD
jgi:hypothetical protein